MPIGVSPLSNLFLAFFLKHRIFSIMTKNDKKYQIAPLNRSSIKPISETDDEEEAKSLARDFAKRRGGRWAIFRRVVVMNGGKIKPMELPSEDYFSCELCGDAVLKIHAERHSNRHARRKSTTQ